MPHATSPAAITDQASPRLRGCIYCGHDIFVPMVDRPDYAFLVHTSRTETKWVRFAISVGCCQRCGVATMLRLPTGDLLDEIYGEYYRTYPSSSGPVESEERVHEFLGAFAGLPAGGCVLELGSYDGRLLAVLKRRGFTVLGCDPNAAAAAHAKTAHDVDTVPGYFSASLFGGKRFDVLMSRLLLEHVLQPQTMWADLNQTLEMGGHVAHEVPNCRYSIEAGLPFFVIEHSTFFTPDSIGRVLDAAGFCLDELQETPGFLRVRAHKVREVTRLTFDGAAQQASMERDLAMVGDYHGKFAERNAKVNGYLEEARRANRAIAVYGVGYFFSFLIDATTLRLDEIVVACDGNPDKWNVTVPGLRAPVQPPEGIRAPEVGLVVVASQNYGSVLTRLQPYLQTGGHVLVFAPEPRVITASSSVSLTSRQTPVLTGQRVELAAFTESDVGEPYLRWLNDPEVTAFLEVRFAKQTRERALEFVRSFFGGAEKYMWSIRHVPDRQPIGTATLHTVNRHHGGAELGILLGEKAFWGGTTAQEVLSLLIAFAFGPLGLRRVTAGTYARHWGMNLIYKKLGFTLEGTLRKAYHLGDGVYVDGYRWGLLADEWLINERNERRS